MTTFFLLRSKPRIGCCSFVRSLVRCLVAACRVLVKDALPCANSKKIPGKRGAQVWSFRRARRTQKNVGQIGLLGNLYDALFFGFRAPIGILK